LSFWSSLAYLKGRIIEDGRV